jgi:hypothetical protein
MGRFKDLIVKTPETDKYVIDLFGKQELLYLGPDEQVRCGYAALMRPQLCVVK